MGSRESLAAWEAYCVCGVGDIVERGGEGAVFVSRASVVWKWCVEEKALTVEPLSVKRSILSLRRMQDCAVSAWRDAV